MYLLTTSTRSERKMDNTHVYDFSFDVWQSCLEGLQACWVGCISIHNERVSVYVKNVAICVQNFADQLVHRWRGQLTHDIFLAIFSVSGHQEYASRLVRFPLVTWNRRSTYYTAMKWFYGEELPRGSTGGIRLCRKCSQYLTCSSWTSYLSSTLKTIVWTQLVLPIKWS